MSVSSSRIVPSAHAFAIDPENSLGLSLKVCGGYLLGGMFSLAVPGVVLTLANNAKTYVEVSAVGHVASNTTAFTDGAVFLYVVTTSNGVVVSIADWRSSPGIPSSGVSVDVLKATVTLTDTQIKNIRGAPDFGSYQVLAAPGVGKLIMPLGVSVVTNLAAAYDNVDASAQVRLAYDVDPDTGQYLDIARFDTASSLIFGQSGRRTIPIIQAGGGLSGGVPQWGPLADYANKNLGVYWNNAGLNFTGGDPANTLSVTAVYAVVDV